MAELVLVSLALLSTATATARARGADVAGPVALVPPELLERVDAVYPEQARREGLQATVALRLTIDAEGHVSEAEVIEPAGHGFDEAAQQAALRFRFAPARRGAQAISARVRYAYAFELPAEPAATPAPADAAVSTPAPAAPTPPEAATAPPRDAVTREPQIVAVQVHGKRTESERLQQSAEAVNVVETKRAKQQSADMAEVLARTQGVAVRREGGLGSSARFSLDGLSDDQVRFFLDGVPLDFAGYPFGIGNVPVNLVERIEVYRGVVPVRFGADALGGALNLVTDQTYRSRLGASYQVGSFGTHRLTLDGRYRDERTGLFVGATGFLDRAKNDYPVDVEIPDARGRLSAATVKRFHDGYRAAGGTLEAGVLDRPWAKRLLVRGFLSGYRKELQNNLIMTVPYGEAQYGETVWGLTALYDLNLRPDLSLEWVANYAHRSRDFVDKSRWVYDWNGRRIRERQVAGEISSNPTDQSVWQNSGFGRATVSWSFRPGHTLRASLSPMIATRTGDDRIQPDPNARDPLTAKRDLFTFVSGVEYESNLLGERLSNIGFVKDYYYHAAAEDPLPGGVFRPLSSDSHTQGVGDSLRFRFTPWLYAKASYEYATRLPRPDEVFGNGVLVLPNLELEPEVSHNANLGPRIELRRSRLGDLTLDVNAFLRDSHSLIVLLGNDRFYTYQNVYRSRGLGLDGAASWLSPGRWLALDGTLTWQDVRNASTAGAFEGFKGDRIPNRPYLFGSWAARLRFVNLPGPDDTLEPFYSGRYVHEFYRSWESQGLRAFKQVIDAQVTHNVGLSWTVNTTSARVTSTFEVDNLGDAQVFDNFGQQRPGRAFYLKTTGEI